MSHKLERTLHATSDDTADVACFGEILWDVFETGPHSFRREIGGAPANVAVCLGRLGVRSRVVGGLGRDRFGEALRQALETSGVCTRYAPAMAQRTGLAFVRHDAHGEPSFLFYRHETADMTFGPKELASGASLARFGLVGTSTLLSPHAKAATLKFAEALRRKRGVLVVDLNVRAHLWPDARSMRREIAELLRHADIVKGSEVDAAALGGWSWIRAQATGAGADTIWLETRGPKPSRGRGRFGSVSCRPAAAPVVDATGAGDAFIAGVMATLVRCAAHPTLPVWHDRALWQTALAIGNELARKAISSPGAVRGVVGLRSIQRALRVAAERVQS